MAGTGLFRVTNILTAIISLATALYLIPFVPNLLVNIDETLVTLTKSRKILNSMYPERVRSRLLNSIVVASYDDECEESFDFKHFDIGSETNDSIELASTTPQESCFSYPNDLDHTERGEQQQNNKIKNLEGEDGMATGRKGKILRKLGNKKLDMRAGLTNYLRRMKKRSDFVSVREGQKNLLEDVAPIADTLPEVSIMFADLTNFTAWSSKHTPIEVFTLLEKIFLTFDEIALTLGVFKLGTVGDCYIAATGIPEPQENHGFLLAVFADKCRQAVKKIIASLTQQDLIIDATTASNNISMRFGIHSGPVTAGVLRGHKSRFELFGDTINTASRMESTGVPGEIQISEETAQLVSQGGGDKRFSLILRTDPINAKGKGLMKTYFLNSNTFTPSDIV